VGVDCKIRLGSCLIRIFIHICLDLSRVYNDILFNLCIIITSNANGNILANNRPISTIQMSINIRKLHKFRICYLCLNYI
jgi:hypothetical protein